MTLLDVEMVRQGKTLADAWEDPAFSIAAVMRGDRPFIPEATDPQLAVLIERCWSHDPRARPTFSKIKELIEEVAGASKIT